MTESKRCIAHVEPHALGPPVPLAQIHALFEAADITTEDPWAAMARLGVQIAYPPEAP